jgi:CheY-like chemotaxis protein
MTGLSLRKKIMVVDDSEIVLAVAQYALQSAGFEVVTHPRPAGCIALVLQEAPDMLLIDVNMPGLNGDTVVKMLGSTQSDSEMVVLLHSSLTDDVLARKAAASRAHGYIRKTDNPQDLVRQVTRWVRPGLRNGTQRLSPGKLDIGEAAEPRRAASSGHIPVAPCQAGKILLVDHEMVELSDLRKLLLSQPGAVEFALSGKELLRRLASESPPDAVILGRLAGSPSCDEVLCSAVRLDPHWKARIVIIHDEPFDTVKYGDIVRLRRPLTASGLLGAIQRCLRQTKSNRPLEDARALRSTYQD